jgi:MOSC domain-containing protein YiiM
MVAGRVVSVNVGLPRNVIWNSHNVSTGIFKEPIAGRVKVRRLGFDGDKQADLTVHGGPEKAVYAYPSEHYEFWRAELGRTSLPWGMFGENLTTQGLLEDMVRLRDEYRIGSATVVVTQPRFPCYKLGIRFGTMEMVSRFQASGRSGFYLSVLEEGEVGAGDTIELIRRETSYPTVSDDFAAERGES